MKFNRREATFIRNLLSEWEERGYLSREKAGELEESFEVSSYNWKSITQTAFIAATVCGLIAFVIILRQDLLVDLFYRLINAPYPVLCLLFALLAVFLFWWGRRRKVRKPTREYTNEFIVLSGGIAAGTSIAFFGKMLGEEASRFAPLVLLGSALYLAVGKWLPSLIMWFAGLIALGLWFGFQTWQISGNPWCFSGINLPVRYAGFGLVMVILSWGMKYLDWERRYRELTGIVALFYLFGALLLLTIFGHFCVWEQWQAAPWWTFLPFSLLLAGVSGLAFWWGSRSGDLLLRGFGITFFLLGIYSKYVEHGWDYLHRALFFAILGISFWMIGRRAEYIWSFGHIDHQEMKTDK